jgi:hypothetical protein
MTTSRLSLAPHAITRAGRRQFRRILAYQPAQFVMAAEPR